MPHDIATVFPRPYYDMPSLRFLTPRVTGVAIINSYRGRVRAPPTTRFQIRKGLECIGRVTSVRHELFQDPTENKILHEPPLYRIEGSGAVTRLSIQILIATWSLGKHRTSAMRMVMKTLSILDKIRRVPSRAPSFLLKLGCDLSSACGKVDTKVDPEAAYRLGSPSESLSGHVQSPFLRFTNVEVIDDNTQVSTWQYHASVVGDF